jgi:hypothetical protein
MLMPHHQNPGKNHSMKIDNRFFENVAQFKYWAMQQEIRN